MDYYEGEFMHFNVLKLEKRLEKLELLLNSTSDINKKIELSRDISSLRIMINYVSGSEYENPEKEKFFDDCLIDKNKELASLINSHGWDIYKSMYFYSSGYSMVFYFCQLSCCIIYIELDDDILWHH